MLRTDLEVRFTFAAIASDAFETVSAERGTQSRRTAEDGYATISRFLSDPKHVLHVPDEVYREPTAKRKRLRAKLDEL